MAQLDKTFPTNDCAMCILSPKLVEAGRHLNIRLITNAELKEVSGKPGQFRVKVLKRPRYVDMDKCTGCGLCAESDLTDLKEMEEEIWVDRLRIDEASCVQCGDCAQVCLEENEERQGITSVVRKRRSLVELPAEERAGRPLESLWQEIALMDTPARAEYWQQAFSKCIKCYGCRDVCPVCVCDECELIAPEWITPGKIPPEFPLFHLIRAYHVADSCVNCVECEATCPVSIPLRSLQQLIWRQPPETVFESVPGLDAEEKEKLIRQTRERPIAQRGVRA